VAELAPVETNIVICRLAPATSTEQVLAHLAAAGFRALAIGEGVLRFVFHLDVGDADVEVILAALDAYR
jgi:threonine aldolase